jgi:hypothetical protein
MFRYLGFGLHIESELEFPEFLPHSFLGYPDLTIKYGETPAALFGDNVVHKVNCSIDSDRYLFWLPIARYYVSAGNSILVSPSEGADVKSVRLFLLSNGMAAILHQRREIMLHASAICVSGGVVLFCGHSGAGKSTIVASLQAKGYQIFSDDICILKHNKDSIHVLPSYPMMKLWDDSFEKLDMEKPELEMKIRPELNKYSKFFHANFQTASMPVLKIFLLSPVDSGSKEIIIKPLSTMAAFINIQSQTYRTGQINAMGIRNQHFSLISDLCAKIPVYEICRRRSENTVNELAEQIICYLPFNESK